MKTIKTFKKEIISRNSDSSIFIGNLVDEILEFAERFIPIEEELPPLNEYVLFKYSEGEYCVGCLNVYGYYCSPYNPNENDHASIHLLSEVTHWRPLFRK